MLCDYGCGRDAVHFNTRKKKWCCEPKAHSCPEVRRKNSERQRDQEHQDRRRQNFRDRHGVDHQMHLAAVKAKIRETCTDRYGTDWASKSDVVLERTRETVRELHGVDWIGQAETVKVKIRETFEHRYGGHPMKCSDIRSKVARTLFERYGVHNAGQTTVSIRKASQRWTRGRRYKLSMSLRERWNENKEAILALKRERHGWASPFEFAHNRSRRSVSRKETAWLDSLALDGLIRQHRLPDLGCCVDGYHPATQTIYLFHGDFWHGNPSTTDHTKVNPRTGTTYGELYEATLRYEAKLRDAGYMVVTIWENEFDDRVGPVHNPHRPVADW